MTMSGLLREVTKEEIETFHCDGAVMLKGVMGTDWTEVLEEGLEFANDHPDGMSLGLSAPLRIDQWPAAHSPKLKQILDESPLAQIVGTVIDAPVRFYMDQMFYKPAGMIAPSAWHQDTCYYNVEGHQLVRAWICADPTPKSISMEVVRGSHLWNATYRPPVGMDPKDNPAGAKALDDAFTAGKVLIGREAHDHFTYFESFLDPSLPELPDIDALRDSFDIQDDTRILFGISFGYEDTSVAANETRTSRDAISTNVVFKSK